MYPFVPALFQRNRRTLQADFFGGVLTSDAGFCSSARPTAASASLTPWTAPSRTPATPTLSPTPSVACWPNGSLASPAATKISTTTSDSATIRSGKPPSIIPDPTTPPNWRPRRPYAAWRTACVADLVKMASALVECFITSHAVPPEELVLDFDATDDPVHGRQENRFFHGYYDGYCFLPLYVTCGDHLLVAYLRPSNIDAALHSRAILKLLVRRLRQAWPEVRLVVRADSGFCRWRLMRWCDRHGVDYLLGLAKNPVLQRQATAWQEQAEQAFRGDADGQAQRGSGSFAMRRAVGIGRGG